jgi:outer membrane protein assembly factor BamB
MINKQFKLKISVISTITLLLTSAILVTLPIVSAQDSRMSYPFIGAIPNPVGVNQQVLLHVGITEQRSSTEQGWEGLTVSVIAPDGNTQTLGPFRTDSTGGTGTIFVPTQVGSYRLQTHFPEQTVLVIPFGGPIPPYNLTFEAGISEELELVVQEDPIPYYPGSPLPQEYWTRPIDSQHREWTTIAGNWVDIPPNRNAPNNEDAPETAHILWAKPLTTGGLVGGDVGPSAQGFTCGDAYQGKFGSSVIIAGKLFYNRFHTGFAASPPQQGIVAVDLHTGEEIWFKNNTRLAFGQTFYFSSVNQHGAFAYLWDGNWNCYDAFTGEWVYSMENVPAGIQTIGPNGEILRYVVNTNAGWMALWNSTAAVNLGGGFFSHTWAPEGGTFDASAPTAYSWNVSIPTDLPGSARMAFVGDKIIGSNVPSGSFGDPANAPITSWALSLSSGHEGALLFTNTWQPPTGDVHIIWAAASSEDGVFVYAGKETRALYVFSMADGSYQFTTETQPYMDVYTLGETRAIPRAIVIADGKIFSVGVAGILYCFDSETGNTLWTYEATDRYSEILWANAWWLNIMFVTDGKIYLAHDEHSPIDPKPRGAPFICIDVESGNEVWKIEGAFRQTQWGGSAVIGDSIIGTMNTYDQRIYAIGKGPSETSLKVETNGIALGSPAVVSGTVIDVSPGTKDPTIALRFPAGVPAIADEHMSEWMKYVYMQFERPTTVVGVEVRIQVVDPNGQYAWIGTATSDAWGNYQYSFIPQLKGTYTIFASFVGSNSYYPSENTAYLTVGDAPPTITIPTYPGYQGPSAEDVANRVVASLPADATPQEVAQAVVNAMPEYPEQQEVPDYTNMFIILLIAVAIAIVIGLVAIIMIQKKS